MIRRKQDNLADLEGRQLEPEGKSILSDAESTAKTPGVYKTTTHLDLSSTTQIPVAELTITDITEVLRKNSD